MAGSADQDADEVTNADEQVGAESCEWRALAVLCAVYEAAACSAEHDCDDGLSGRRIWTFAKGGAMK